MKILKHPAVIAVLAGILMAILTTVSRPTDALAVMSTVTQPATAIPVHGTPAARTCAAFRTWDHKRTAANLNTLMADSITAPWMPLGTDVVILFMDVRDHDTIDTRDDVTALGEDCRTVR